jgi:hypothetical protein
MYIIPIKGSFELHNMGFESYVKVKYREDWTSARKEVFPPKFKIPIQVYAGTVSRRGLKRGEVEMMEFGHQGAVTEDISQALYINREI